MSLDACASKAEYPVIELKPERLGLMLRVSFRQSGDNDHYKLITDLPPRKARYAFIGKTVHVVEAWPFDENYWHVKVKTDDGIVTEYAVSSPDRSFLRS